MDSNRLRNAEGDFAVPIGEFSARPERAAIALITRSAGNHERFVLQMVFPFSDKPQMIRTRRVADRKAKRSVGRMDVCVKRIRENFEFADLTAGDASIVPMATAWRGRRSETREWRSHH